MTKSPHTERPAVFPDNHLIFPQGIRANAWLSFKGRQIELESSLGILLAGLVAAPEVTRHYLLAKIMPVWLIRGDESFIATGIQELRRRFGQTLDADLPVRFMPTDSYRWVGPAMTVQGLETGSAPLGEIDHEMLGALARFVAAKNEVPKTFRLEGTEKAMALPILRFVNSGADLEDELADFLKNGRSKEQTLKAIAALNHCALWHEREEKITSLGRVTRASLARYTAEGLKGFGKEDRQDYIDVLKQFFARMIKIRAVSIRPRLRPSPMSTAAPKRQQAALEHDGRPKPPAKMTPAAEIHPFAEKYLNRKQAEGEASSRKSALNHFMAWMAAQEIPDFNMLTPAHVRLYRDVGLTGYTDGSQAVHFSRVAGFLRFLEDEGEVDGNLLAGYGPKASQDLGRLKISAKKVATANL